MPESDKFEDTIEGDEPPEAPDAGGSGGAAPPETNQTEEDDPFGESTDSRDAIDMTRDELKAHLDATEERVRRMTEGVSEKLDKHLEVMQESNERFKAEVREDLGVMKESNKWTYRLTAATLTVLIIVVGLIGVLLGG